jgi:hypothetical protein
VALIVVSSGFLVSITGVYSEYGFYANNKLAWADICNSTLSIEFAIYAGLTSEDIMEYWYPLNGSYLQVSIDELPDLASSMTAQWYIENIANSDKVDVRNINGSEIPFSLRIILEKVISLLVFPVGNWEYFDEQFGVLLEQENQDGTYPRFYEYQGESKGDTLYSFYRSWSEHKTGVGTYRSITQGDIGKSMGIPVYISHYWAFGHTDGFEYTIILSQNNL